MESTNPLPSLMIQGNEQMQPLQPIQGLNYSHEEQNHQPQFLNPMHQPLGNINPVNQFTQDGYQGQAGMAYTEFFKPGVGMQHYYAPNTQLYNHELQSQGKPPIPVAGQSLEQLVQQTTFSSSHKYAQNVLTHDTQTQVYNELFQAKTLHYRAPQPQDSQLYGYNPQIPPQGIRNYFTPNVNTPDYNYNYNYNQAFRGMSPALSEPTKLKGIQQLQMGSPLRSSKFQNRHQFQSTPQDNPAGAFGLASHYSGGTVLQGSSPTGQNQRMLPRFFGATLPPGTSMYGYMGPGSSYGSSNSNVNTPVTLTNYIGMNQQSFDYNAAQSVNTPVMVAHTPSPSSIDVEDKVYFEKVRELRKYTGLLIAKIGNAEVEKSSKIKTLLEVLSAPNPKRLSMECLFKCEHALKNMEQAYLAGLASAPAPPRPAPTSYRMSAVPFAEFVSAVQLLDKNPHAANTWKRVVQPALEDVLEQSMEKYEEEEDSDEDTETSNSSSIPWVLDKELQHLDISRFHVKLTRTPLKSTILQLECKLLDTNLPTVPNLKLEIDPKYPDMHPTIVGMGMEYTSTAMFTSVHETFQSRMFYVNYKYTVTELLNIWEMSVRQVSNPKFKAVSLVLPRT